MKLLTSRERLELNKRALRCHSAAEAMCQRRQELITTVIDTGAMTGQTELNMQLLAQEAAHHSLFEAIHKEQARTGVQMTVWNLDDWQIKISMLLAGSLNPYYIEKRFGETAFLQIDNSCEAARSSFYCIVKWLG